MSGPCDRDVVLFCSCPNEASAARAALILRKYGITRVRPPPPPRRVAGTGLPHT